MRVIRIVGISAATILLVGTVIALMMPSTWSVERSITIDAPAATVFALIGDLRRWNDWTLWNDENDPTLKRAFSGPAVGVGSKSAWEGEALGKGHMIVTAYEPPLNLAYDLYFEGMDEPSHGGLTLVEADGKTKATWYDSGDVGMNLVARFFVSAMDSFLGPDFEGGLANIKKLAEEAAKAKPQDSEGDLGDTKSDTP